MKKIFSILMALAVVLGANAQALKVAGKQMQKGLNIQKTATVEKAQLPTIEKAMNRSHNRLTPVKAVATNIKKAPALVNNGQIVTDFMEATFYSSEITETVALWEFDFFNGNDFSAYVIVEAIDGTHIAGTYSIQQGKVVVAAGDSTNVASGSLAITYDAPNTSYQIVLSATCANGQTYTLNQAFNATTDMYAFDYELVYLYENGWGWLMGISSYEDCLIELEDAPFVPTGDTIYCDLGRAEIEYYDEYGDYYIMAENEGYDYAGSLDIYATTLAGTYGPDDIEMEYTQLYDMVAQKEIALKAAISATIVETPDTTFINALLMGKDGNVYAISMKEYAIAITDTVAIHFVTPKWNEHVAEAGWWQVVGAESADSAYVVSLSNNENDQVAGTYTLPDMDPEYTYIYIGAENKKYGFINLTVTITVAADGAVTIVAQGDAKNGVHYNMTFDVIPGTTGWKELYEAGDLKKYIQNGQVFIEKNGVKYNAAGVKF